MFEFKITSSIIRIKNNVGNIEISFGETSYSLENNELYLPESHSTIKLENNTLVINCNDKIRQTINLSENEAISFNNCMKQLN